VEKGESKMVHKNKDRDKQQEIWFYLDSAKKYEKIAKNYMKFAKECKNKVKELRKK
jgi:hypothetical protein